MERAPFCEASKEKGILKRTQMEVVKVTKIAWKLVVALEMKHSQRGIYTTSPKDGYSCDAVTCVNYMWWVANFLFWWDYRCSYLPYRRLKTLQDRWGTRVKYIWWVANFLFWWKFTCYSLALIHLQILQEITKSSLRPLPTQIKISGK